MEFKYPIKGYIKVTGLSFLIRQTCDLIRLDIIPSTDIWSVRGYIYSSDIIRQSRRSAHDLSHQLASSSQKLVYRAIKAA